MIKTEKCETVEKAFRNLIERDEKYILIRHELEPGREIKEHSHEDANEFVIVKNGSFKVLCDNKSQEFNLDNEVVVIYFPRGSTHSLKNLGDILKYFVVRKEF